MSESKNIERLFQRYLNNECSSYEIKLLLRHFDAIENEDLLKSLIRKQSDAIEGASIISPQAQQDLLDNAFAEIKKAIAGKNKSQSSVKPIYTRFWFRMCAAAVFVLMMSTTIYYFVHQKNERVVAQNENSIPSVKDIAPGNNNAILTLDNGATIVLDSAANGILAQQGNADVQKINGQIAYRNTDTNPDSKPVYNKIATSVGNQYQLTLTDGTRVWLNASSSIHFPASFAGNERKVDITGEVYFEVAKDARKPFKVAFKDKSGAVSEIEVLGTHFNVNTYIDEPEMKTTLLEGSVKIKNASGVKLLAPGQQARISPKGIEIKLDADIDQVMAWKNGYFLFDNTDIHTLMRQVARWYNVDVDFERDVTEDGFSGRISRDVPLSKLIEVFELNDVRASIEGRTITIGQKK